MACSLTQCAMTIWLLAIIGAFAWEIYKHDSVYANRLFIEYQHFFHVLYRYLNGTPLYDFIPDKRLDLFKENRWTIIGAVAGSMVGTLLFSRLFKKGGFMRNFSVWLFTLVTGTYALFYSCRTLLAINSEHDFLANEYIMREIPANYNFYFGTATKFWLITGVACLLK